MTVDEQYDVVIVGAGHGGTQAAITLRQAGFGGSIALLSEETELPYERPPLSKDYLAGTKSSDRILIRPARFWPEKSIDLILATRAVRVDPDTKIIHCSDGRAIGYGCQSASKKDPLSASKRDPLRRAAYRVCRVRRSRWLRRRAGVARPVAQPARSVFFRWPPGVSCDA